MKIIKKQNVPAGIISNTVIGIKDCMGSMQDDKAKRKNRPAQHGECMMQVRSRGSFGAFFLFKYANLREGFEQQHQKINTCISLQNNNSNHNIIHAHTYTHPLS